MKVPKNKTLRLGLAWSGSNAHKNDANRSISFSSFKPLLNLDCIFYSLQDKVRECDEACLSGSERIVHFGDELECFADTAALIEQLDLIISVDTAVVHLAGALNKEVWVLIPFNSDWRWLLDRTDSPWYPSMRLFRQRKEETWNDVIFKVCSELEKFKLQKIL